MGKWGRWFSKETELKSYETGIQVSLHPAASSPITFNRLTNSETHKGLAEWRRGKEHYKMNGKLGISVAEAARRLGISTRTAYTWARRADFPSFRIGNRIVVYEKGLEEWMKKMMETKAA